MAEADILFITSDPELWRFFEKSLEGSGFQITHVDQWEAAETVLQTQSPDLVVMSDQVNGHSHSDYSPLWIDNYPFIPFILLISPGSGADPLHAVRSGCFDAWKLPLRSEDMLRSLRRALARRKNWIDLARRLNQQASERPDARARVIETLQRVGSRITSTFDLDEILNAVVDAAVELTGAEEGSLLLLDEPAGEFYMRASRNFNEDFARNFRLPEQDRSLAEVIRTGKPLVFSEKTPQKLKTAYLVHTLVFMPIRVKEYVIGVLEVDHRESGPNFTEQHLSLLAALADYAAIAIENTRLYRRTEAERKQLETILINMEEAVIVVDSDARLVMVNRKARHVFGIQEGEVHGRRAQEIITHAELLEILTDTSLAAPTRMEISLEDGRVLNSQVTPLPGVGLAVSMQDITHLKELDQIKSDFVHTVSHDLRSPLTAILGYAELLDRVGPVNDQQREFIHRVQMSVQNITALINDLLDLGRIEAGFDARKEVTAIGPIAHYAIDGMMDRFTEKSQELIMNVPDDLPPVLGNPVRLRQMLNNLAVNANKYTQTGGSILVSAHAEGSQVILHVSDNGPGIPLSEQPFIFDKFYRASNVKSDIPGTGLGLAIVRSIVENHDGRIWVDSQPGKGTTFTVVLPTIESNM